MLSYVVEYMAHKIVDNKYILYRLLIMFVFMAVSELLVSHHMRMNGLIINENEMVRMG